MSKHSRGGKREYVRKNNFEKKAITLKNKVHYKMYIELTPREAVTSKKHWPYHYKLSHMAYEYNTYERTNNIDIMTDQTHSQMRRLELA